jgi:hypothetical protein
VLTGDPGLGVWRRADAGYDEAVEVARTRGVKVPGLTTQRLNRLFPAPFPSSNRAMVRWSSGEGRMPLDVRSRIAAAAAVLSAWALVNTCENPPPAPRQRPPPTRTRPMTLFDLMMPLDRTAYYEPRVVDPYPFPIEWQDRRSVYDVGRMAREHDWPGKRTKRAVAIGQAYYAGTQWPNPAIKELRSRDGFWTLPEGVPWAESTGRRCKGKELWIVPVGWVWGCEADCDDGENWTTSLYGGTGGAYVSLLAVAPAPSLRFEVLTNFQTHGFTKAGRGDCPALTFAIDDGPEDVYVAWRWSGKTYEPERPVP